MTKIYVAVDAYDSVRESRCIPCVTSYSAQSATPPKINGIPVVWEEYEINIRLDKDVPLNCGSCNRQINPAPVMH